MTIKAYVAEAQSKDSHLVWRMVVLAHSLYDVWCQIDKTVDPYIFRFRESQESGAWCARVESPQYVIETLNDGEESHEADELEWDNGWEHWQESKEQNSWMMFRWCEHKKQTVVVKKWKSWDDMGFIVPNAILKLEAARV